MQQSNSRVPKFRNNASLLSWLGSSAEGPPSCSRLRRSPEWRARHIILSQHDPRFLCCLRLNHPARVCIWGRCRELRYIWTVSTSSPGYGSQLTLDASS